MSLSLSLAQPIDRPVSHSSDKHLPVLSHSPSFAKVCWTVKPLKGLNSAKASISLMTTPSQSQKRKGRLQEQCEGKDSISPVQLQIFFFFFFNYDHFGKRKHRSIRKPELLTSTGCPNAIPVIYSTGLYTYP